MELAEYSAEDLHANEHTAKFTAEHEVRLDPASNWTVGIPKKKKVRLGRAPEEHQLFTCDVLFPVAEGDRGLK